jgi:hypothetical protein
MRVGTNGSSSGLNVVQSSVPVNVEYIALSGNVGLTGVTPSSTDVVDFLSGSLRSNSCTSCSGTIQTSNETPITFSWTSIQFDQIEAVPAPIPIVGGIAAFGYSRKIRARIKKSLG